MPELPRDAEPARDADMDDAAQMRAIAEALRAAQPANQPRPAAQPRWAGRRGGHRKGRWRTVTSPIIGDPVFNARHKIRRMGVADSKLLEARGSAGALDKIAEDDELAGAICASGAVRIRAFVYALNARAGKALCVFGSSIPISNFEPPEIGDVIYLADAIEAALRTENEYAPYSLALLLAGAWRPLDDTFQFRLLRSAIQSNVVIDTVAAAAVLMSHIDSGRFAYMEHASEIAYRAGHHCAALLVVGYRPQPNRRNLECGCIYCEVSGVDVPWFHVHREDESPDSAFGVICSDIDRALSIGKRRAAISIVNLRQSARRIMWTAYPSDDPSVAEVRARLRPCPPRRGPEGGCSVCLETRPLALAVPCGHFSACFRCAARLGGSPCVLCRTPVASHISTWPVPPPAE